MTYIQTIPPDEAAGTLKEVYDAELRSSGVVDNGVRAFSLRPAAFVAWQQLRDTIQSNLDPRRYELVTLAAAASLRCSYCAMAHGAILASRFFSVEQVEALTRDYRNAGLGPAEVAMMAYAEKIARNAYKVTPEDIDGLRAHGFTDAEILDIALAAAARSFLSKVLDAVGVEPDEWYLDMPDKLREALTVGRPLVDEALPVKL